MSPKSYEILRESEIELPTRRNLNDYTHWLGAEPGFHNSIDNMLVTEANIKDLEDWKKYYTYNIIKLTSIVIGM